MAVCSTVCSTPKNAKFPVFLEFRMEQLRIRHRYAVQVRLQEQGVIVPRQTTVFRNKALSEAWRCLGGMRGMVLRRVKLQGNEVSK
ncbi:hypothetical protein B5M06_13550 [Comamonas kerstersii]|uniref:Uncharacterized protein n=1 Tax=Comamonas kerstersii TaxID=225992 RepID=A0A1V0BGR4_9BURK|nr:hypothetical protein B5M06_13550 [Comamonas kerstersii]